MATGDILASWTARNAEPPDDIAFTAAVPDTRAHHIVVDFDDSDTETVFFSTVLPQRYAGNGVVVIIYYAMSSATADEVIWGAAFEEMDGTDIDSDSFATERTTVDTVPGTAGVVETATIVFLDGAQMDSVGKGDLFRLKISRLGDDASTLDNAAGDAELIAVEVKEN